MSGINLGTVVHLSAEKYMKATHKITRHSNEMFRGSDNDCLETLGGWLPLMTIAEIERRGWKIEKL